MSYTFTLVFCNCIKFFVIIFVGCKLHILLHPRTGVLANPVPVTIVIICVSPFFVISPITVITVLYAIIVIFYLFYFSLPCCTTIESDKAPYPGSVLTGLSLRSFTLLYIYTIRLILNLISNNRLSYTLYKTTFLYY